MACAREVSWQELALIPDAHLRHSSPASQGPLALSCQVQSSTVGRKTMFGPDTAESPTERRPP